MKHAISLRISELINIKASASPKILNINLTTWYNLFPEEELKHKNYRIKNIVGNFSEVLSANSFKEIENEKFDLIFIQFPLGIKKPDTNEIMIELIEKNLVNNGFVLNVSTVSAFSVRLEKYFPKFTRLRENILGNIYKPETGVNISLYEYMKGPINDLWMFGIHSCDFRNFLEKKNDLKNIKIISTPKAYFYSAEVAIAQQEQIDRFKLKNLIPKYIRDVSLDIHRVDLLPSNKNRNEVKDKISNFENAVFLPVIPSKTNKAEIFVKNLVSTRYWLLTFDPGYFLNEYVQNYLNSADGKEQLISLSVGSYIPSLNKEALGRVCIPMKDTEKQEKVVKNRKKIDDAYKLFHEYMGKISDKVEEEDFEFKPEEFIKKFPDYTMRNLITMEESKIFERKSTLRFDTKEKQPKDYITDQALKTVVAFLNTDGGTLIVGQSDDKEIVGIEVDKFKNQDDCSKYFKDKIKTKIGIKFLETYIQYNFYKHQNKTLLVVSCNQLPLNERAFLNESDFFIRSGPSNEKLSTKATLEYIELKSQKSQSQ